MSHFQPLQAYEPEMMDKSKVTKLLTFTWSSLQVGFNCMYYEAIGRVIIISALVILYEQLIFAKRGLSRIWEFSEV